MVTPASRIRGFDRLRRIVAGARHPAEAPGNHPMATGWRPPTATPVTGQTASQHTGRHPAQPHTAVGRRATGCQPTRLRLRPSCVHAQPPSGQVHASSPPWVRPRFRHRHTAPPLRGRCPLRPCTARNTTWIRLPRKSRTLCQPPCGQGASRARYGAGSVVVDGRTACPRTGIAPRHHRQPYCPPRP